MYRLFGTVLTVIVALGVSPKLWADDAAKAVVEKAIKAYGGAEHIDKHKGGYFKSKGKVEVAGGIEFTQEVHFAYPDKFKEMTELDVMGTKVSTVTTINGDKIHLLVNGNEMAVPDSAKEALKEGAHIQQVMRLASILSKDFTLSLIGEAKVEGKPAVGVKIAKKGQKDLDLFFDKETNLIVKLERKGINPADGTEVNEERIVTEYSKTSKFPEVKRVLVKHDGKTYVELEVLEMKLLEKVDENLFVVP